MPDQLLAQSALPIGQTPLTVVEAPRVGTSLPGPIDTTNFFRMQQAQQANIGLLQRNEALKLQKQQLDLWEYELMIRDTDSILGMTGNAFTEAYNAHTQSRQKGNSSAMGAFGLLDLTKPMHAAIIQKNQRVYDAAQAQLDQIGSSYLNSGSKDPGTRYETVRQIRNVINDTNRQLMSDKDFVKYTTQQENFNTWWDQLATAYANGKNINAEAVDRMLEKYRAFTEEGQGDVRLEDFRPDKYTYDGTKALTNIATDAKNLGLGTEEFAQIGIGNGGALKGTQTTRRSLDEITDLLVDKYQGDPNAVALYNNTAKGRLTFKEWIGLQAAPHAPLEGKEVTVTAESGSPIIKPGSGKSAGQPSGFISVTKESLGGKEPSVEQTDRIGREKELWNEGFDNTDIGFSDWIKIDKYSEDEENPVRKTYYKGNQVLDAKDKASADRVEYSMMNPLTGKDEVIGSAGKRRDVQDYEDKINAGLVPITSSVLSDQGVEMTIKGDTAWVSGNALGLLKDLAKDFPEFNNKDNVITSLFRSEEENKMVGGSSNSYHKRGHAIDMRSQSEEGRKLAEWVESEPGKQWLKEHNYEAGIHGGVQEDGTNTEHIHFQPLPINDSFLATEDDPVETTAVATTEGPIDGVRLNDEAEANAVLNRILLGDTTLDISDVDFMFEHPPARGAEVIMELKQQWGRLPRLRREATELSVKSRISDLTNKEMNRLAELQDEIQGIEDTNDVMGIREKLLPLVAKELEPKLMEQFLDQIVLDTTPGESGTISIGLDDRYTKSMVITRDPDDNNFYAVQYLDHSDKVNSVKIYDRDQLKEVLQMQAPKFAEEEVALIFPPERVDEAIKANSRFNLQDYQNKIEQKKAILMQKRAQKARNNTPQNSNNNPFLNINR